MPPLPGGMGHRERIPRLLVRAKRLENADSDPINCTGLGCSEPAGPIRYNGHTMGRSLRYVYFGECLHQCEWGALVVLL